MAIQRLNFRIIPIVMRLAAFNIGILLTLIAWADDPPLVPRLSANKPTFTTPGANLASRDVIVKFREGSAVRLRGGQLAASPDVDLGPLGLVLARYPQLSARAFRRVFTRPEQELDAERTNAQNRSNQQLADLNLYYRITLPAAIDAAAFCDQLNQLALIEIAYPAPGPAPPPMPDDLPPLTPDFSVRQDYRASPPGGIGVSNLATVPGSTGTGMTVVDIEYGWYLNHEDLDLASAAIIDTAPFENGYPDHGTAVLGELGGAANSYGITGMVPDAVLRVTPALTLQYGYNLERAVSLATDVLRAGDVMLIEQQTPVCDGPDYGPMEWLIGTFDAIATASASGIVVVEAAGNGAVNLDDPNCGGLFDRNRRDSGAIIVGAGDPVTHNRLGFSTYGSRVDLQGWGESVTTIGYGGLFDPDDVRQRYSADFSGTSSAASIVASAVLAIQGALRAQGKPPLSPRVIRRLLADTGTSSAAPDQGIGPLPNLPAAWNKISRPVNVTWLPAVLRLLQ